jgi:carboxypeptidase family protein
MGNSVVRTVWTLFAVLIVCGITCTSVWAQATAQMSGTVRDQTGAVLPGVEVTAIQTDTGIMRTGVTNETGSYVLSNLPIGPFRLEAALPGFRTFVQTGIVLQVRDSPVINPVLEVGQVSEQIEVQANAALVETRNAGVGQVVENARILDLPLNGRQVVDLIGLAGGTTPAPLVNGSNRDPFATASYSVAGGLSTGVSYTLDGATHNNPQDNGYISMPFPDALQEFKVETSATGAQNGMKSAGSVNLVTKSGTNNIHGDAFEFVRNGIFNARNAFAVRRDTIKRNQFGGTLGGSIIKNKLFFFAGYQGTTLRQDPSDIQAFVPTASMLTGDFSVFASPTCNAGRQITLKAPFVNNRIDPALFNKPALALAAKLPRTADPCGKVIYGNPTQTNDHEVVSKIDYQLSANHSIFGRYLADSLYRPAAYDINKNPLSVGTSDDGLAQAFTVGDTYLFNPNTVNSLRLTANRIAAGKFLPQGMATASLGPADIGIKAYAYNPHEPRYTVTGGFTVNTQGGPNRATTFAINDDLSLVRGNHQLALGASAAAWWVNQGTGTYDLQFTFSGQTTGLGMADFFLGNVSNLINGSPGAQNKRTKYLASYIGDTWKVKQKLTLNYGLRWEPYFPITYRFGGALHYDHDAFAKGIKSTQFANTPPGLFFPGDAGYEGGLQGMHDQWRNFSPRVGLAWDVNGDGRTSIRASAGTFFDFPSTEYLYPELEPPWLPLVTVNDVNFENPWAQYPGGDPFPKPYGRTIGRDASWPLYALVTALDYNTPNMKVSQWNLSMQRQVGTDWLLSASYLGTHSIHIFSIQQINPAVFLGLGPCTLNGVSYSTCSTTANTDQRRRLSLENPQNGKYYGYMDHLDSGGTASYNALLLSIQRRVARGATLNVNYTWSHCITDLAPQGTAQGSNGNTGWINPDNRRYDRGNCSQAATDRRQLFNLSAVASTPQLSNPALRVVVSGWRFSPILRVISGDYMTILTNLDRSLNGIANQHVNQLLADPYGDKSITKYLNPAAFDLPALGTFGNVGRASVRGPASWQFDAALSRTFRLREAQQLEFRAEAFNVTNSFHMNDPITNLNSNTFGQVTSAKDPRIMQFALKYVF